MKKVLGSELLSQARLIMHKIRPLTQELGEKIGSGGLQPQHLGLRNPLFGRGRYQEMEILTGFAPQNHGIAG